MKFIFQILVVFFLALNGFVLAADYESQTDIYARFVPFDKLPENGGRILDINQDQFGYMWFASTKGLFRYDGSSVYTYRSNQPFGGLPDEKVLCLETDIHGRLFIGTHKGLCSFDYENNAIRQILSSQDTAGITDSLSVRAILADGDSLLWLETQRGYLIKMDLNTLEILKKYKHYPVTQPYYFSHDIYRDKRGWLWVGGRGVGPMWLDPVKDELSYMRVEQNQSVDYPKHHTGASWFHESQDGTLWMGAHDGVFHYDRDKHLLRKFIKGSSWEMEVSSDGSLWMHLGDGLVSYNPNTKKMTRYMANEEDPLSLPSHYIYAIFIDSYDQLWVSASDGVAILNDDHYDIDYFFHLPGIEASLASSMVTALEMAENGKVWIGYESKGLDLFDYHAKEVEHFSPGHTEGMNGGNVRSILKSDEGLVYCALWNGTGFGWLNRDTKTFEMFSLDPLSTQVDWYNDMVLNADGNIYLGYWGAKGLALFNTQSRKIERFFTDKFVDPFKSRLITSLHLQNQDKLWMGTTANGLHCYLPEKDTSVCYYEKYNPNTGLPQKQIFDITEDIYGNIWVGSKGLYFIKNGEGKALELPFAGINETPEIYHILADSKNMLWLLTDRGLIKYNIWQNSFTEYPDIVSLKFNDVAAAALELDNGKLLVGGQNGLAMFDPELLNVSSNAPKLYLSSLFVFDTVKIPFLSKHQKVILNHKENFFSVKMGLDVNASNNQFDYYYRLKGFQPEWNILDENTLKASYTNVPPGEYFFELKMEDNKGWGSENLSSMAISVLPPYWDTWWFKGAVAIFALAFVSTIWYLRVRSLRLSLSNANLNLKVMRMQMNPHFIFNALFAIQNYVYAGKPDTAGNYLSDFARLIRLTLKNNREDLIALEDELETMQLYLNMQQLRFENKFSYEFHCDESLKSSDILVPPMLVQPFIENAIEHGIKPLEKGGKLVINYQYETKGIIRFTAEDNGIGLTAATKISKAKKHQSMATEICRSRLAILAKKYRKKLNIDIRELKDEKNKVLGTRVSLLLPFEQ